MMEAICDSLAFGRRIGRSLTQMIVTWHISTGGRLFRHQSKRSLRLRSFSIMPPAEPERTSSYYAVRMPLYEYQCRTCDHRFELLVRAETVPACPSCQSHELDKQLSVFAVGTNSPKFDAHAPAPAPCGTCGDLRGPGACSLN